MAISKKKSRKIVVDGQAYRWAVSEDSGYSVVVVQSDLGSGQKLEALLDWACRTSTATGAGVRIPEITPAMVSQLVRSALREGWRSEARGVPPLKKRLLPDGCLVDR